MIAEKFLNRRFDDLVTVIKDVKRGLTTRHRALAPSEFDGQTYTPGEFHRFTSAFFDNPGGFYQDFNAPGAAPEVHGEDAFEHGVVRDWSMPSGVTGPEPDNYRIHFKQVISSVGEGRGPCWLDPRGKMVAPVFPSHKITGAWSTDSRLILNIDAVLTSGPIAGLGRPERHQYNSAHYSVAFHLKDIKARIVELMTG